jgi:hypothetical protein
VGIEEGGVGSGGAEGFGQAAEEVSQGAEGRVEAGDETSPDHELVDGVGDLEEEVEVFGRPGVLAVGVFQFVPARRDGFFGC